MNVDSLEFILEIKKIADKYNTDINRIYFELGDCISCLIDRCDECIVNSCCSKKEKLIIFYASKRDIDTIKRRFETKDKKYDIIDNRFIIKEKGMIPKYLILG